MPITKLNPLKRKILSFFTASIHNTTKRDGLTELNDGRPITMLITRPNHRLGNQLLLTPLLQAVTKQYPNATIHLVLNGTLSRILFSQYPAVKRIYSLPKKPFKNIFKYLTITYSLKRTYYDIALTACENSNSSKLFVKLARAKFKIYNSGSHTLHKPLHISKYPIYNFKTFINPNVKLTPSDYPPLNLQLTSSELRHGRQVLYNLIGNTQKVISIFTFATGNKCHASHWWDQFYQKLKSNFSDYVVLEVLPMEHVSQIDFKTASYYSRDLREIAAVIANTAIFIGADSGIMHLAASTTTPVLGLFNITQLEVYGPYGGSNEAIDTNRQSIDELIEKAKQILEKKVD
ncbi:glycosyltransferase family 9 protein [Flavobacteriaceae bacterium F08102]|nr:glycosyltransferase family 9 protein [Flavobacteriaceae bacterium F08102]